MNLQLPGTVRLIAIPCTANEFAPLQLGHGCFAVACPLTLLDRRFLPANTQFTPNATFSYQVTLMELRFTPLTAINFRRALYQQVCAHAGRTHVKKPAKAGLVKDIKKTDRLILQLYDGVVPDPNLPSQAPARPSNQAQEWNFPSVCWRQSCHTLRHLIRKIPAVSTEIAM
jgi:hypothetical protein